jgi:4-amino-4-deoxy-L-arabinose transferase-like glycosyltransferase
MNNPRTYRFNPGGFAIAVGVGTALAVSSRPSVGIAVGLALGVALGFRRPKTRLP